MYRISGTTLPDGGQRDIFIVDGMVRCELELFIAAGIDPGAAIGAASWNVRKWLGLPLIEEGAPADLVAYRADPRDDPSVLAEPAVVVLDGTVLRRPVG